MESEPTFCLLCRGALPMDSSQLDWYTQHLENVHTVYFHLDLYMALTFVTEEKIESLTTYIKSITKIETFKTAQAAQPNVAETVAKPINNAETASNISSNPVTETPKRKMVEEEEPSPPKRMRPSSPTMNNLNDDSDSSDLSRTMTNADDEKSLKDKGYKGPLLCNGNNCSFSFKTINQMTPKFCVTHWTKEHGDVSKMTWKDGNSGLLLNANDICNKVGICNFEGCSHVVVGSKLKDFVRSVKDHWSRQHREHNEIYFWKKFREVVVEAFEEKKEEKEDDPETSEAMYAGPFRCTECGWESDDTEDEPGDFAVAHWNEFHGNVLKMELEDVPTEELVTLQELFKFVVKCSMPDCPAVFGSGSTGKECIVKINAHWTNKHGHVPEISDSLKYFDLFNIASSESAEEQVQVNTASSEPAAEQAVVANIKEEVSQPKIKEEAQPERAVESQPDMDLEEDNSEDSEDDMDDQELSDEKLDMKINNLKQMISKSNFVGPFRCCVSNCGTILDGDGCEEVCIKHFSANHADLSADKFQFVDFMTGQTFTMMQLFKDAAKCGKSGCEKIIGKSGSESKSEIEAAFKEHFTAEHFSEPSTFNFIMENYQIKPELNVDNNDVNSDDDDLSENDVSASQTATLDETVYTSNSETNNPPAVAKVKSPNDFGKSGITCLVCAQDNLSKRNFLRHWNSKHLDRDISEFKILCNDSQSIVSASSLTNYLGKCTQQNCGKYVGVNHSAGVLKGAVKDHYFDNHGFVPENFNSPEHYITLDNGDEAIEKSDKSAIEAIEKSAKSAIEKKSRRPSDSQKMKCALCPESNMKVNMPISHWRSFHPEQPVTALRVIRVGDEKVLNLCDIYKFVMKCNVEKCKYVNVSTSRSSDCKHRMKKHLEKSHPSLDSNEAGYITEVSSLGYKCLLEGCLEAAESKKEIVDHHRSLHGEVINVKAREIDTDQVKDLLELFRVVTECGLGCGKVFCGDDEEAIEEEADEHWDKEHSGMPSMPAVRMRRGEGGEVVKDILEEEQREEDGSKDEDDDELEEEDLDEDELDEELDEDEIDQEVTEEAEVDEKSTEEGADPDLDEVGDHESTEDDTDQSLGEDLDPELAEELDPELAEEELEELDEQEEAELEKNIDEMENQ